MRAKNCKHRIKVHEYEKKIEKVYKKLQDSLSINEQLNE